MSLSRRIGAARSALGAAAGLAVAGAGVAAGDRKSVV